MDYEKILRQIRIVVGIVLLGVVTFKITTLPDVDITLTKLNTTIEKANSLLDSTHKFGSSLAKDYFDPDDPQGGFYRHIQDDFASSTRASRHLDDMVIATNENLNGKAGVFSNINTLLASTDTTIKSLSNDLNTLTTSTSDVLVPLKESLGNIDTLTKELSEEIAKGGAIDTTIAALNSNLDSINTLLSDPNIALTIANGQEITKSFASTAKTIDIVLMPYRKRVNQVQLLLKELWGAVKFTFPLAK